MVNLSHFYAGHLQGVIPERVHVLKDRADYGGGMENTVNLLMAVAFREPAEIMM